MIKEVFLASTIATASMTLAMSAHAQSMPQPQDRAPALSVQAPDARAIDGQSLLGLDVFSQDQNRVGSVEKVINSARGEVQAIVIKTGGFLGFGGKLVSITHDRIGMRERYVQVALSAEEVSRLPEVKDGR